MKAVGKSDVGRNRDNNEDRFKIDQDLEIFLLADGMGGHNAGEVASEVAVEEAYAHLEGNIHDSAQDDVLSAKLEDAMFKAHEAIREKAKGDLNLSGMGTTLVELVIKGGKAFICHAGDSRAYLLRDVLSRITKDHTVGDYLVEQHLMPKEAVPPRQWHVLTQAVGTVELPNPDRNIVGLMSGDILLLCSDGLTDMLEDDEIQAIIEQHKDDLDKCSTALIDSANEKGGRDNITVVLVSY